MLQQTQVERVIAGFWEFMRRFPTLEACAAATEDQVVAAFSGMGYYERARRLHHAARAIAGRGSWPTVAADLAALPGLGAYTSAAVAAFAFAGADPPVDGNVARIAARVLALSLPLGGGALAREADLFSRELHSRAPGPEVFEALMELGATVCTPRSPRCPSCPFEAACAGRAEAERFPLPRPRRATQEETWVALWLARADGTVLLRRLDDGVLLAGLWLPPLAVLGPDDEPAATAFELSCALGYGGRLEAIAAIRHSITHRRIRVRPFVGNWSSHAVREARAAESFRDPASPGLPTSSLLTKLHRACVGPRQPRLDDPWDDLGTPE